MIIALAVITLIALAVMFALVLTLIRSLRMTEKLRVENRDLAETLGGLRADFTHLGAELADSQRLYHALWKHRQREKASVNGIAVPGGEDVESALPPDAENYI